MTSTNLVRVLFNSTTALLSALSFRVIKTLIRVALYYALTLLCYTRLSELFYGTHLQRLLLHWLSDYFNENMSPCVSVNIHLEKIAMEFLGVLRLRVFLFFVFKTLDIFGQKNISSKHHIQKKLSFPKLYFESRNLFCASSKRLVTFFNSRAKILEN